MSTRIALRAAAFSSTLLGAAVATAADGHVTYLQDASTYDRPMVLAATDRGIVFIAADHTVFRSFHHTQSGRAGVDQPWLWVADIDGDREDEFVGAGSPSFVVETNGDPIWGFPEGCEQFFAGDFAESDNWEVFCRRERDVEVRTYDGQLYFEWSGRGYELGACYASDYDGDAELEVQCEMGDAARLSFDLEYSDPEEQAEAAIPEAQRGVDVGSVAGAANGSPLQVGSSTVTLGFSGGAITVTSNGAITGSATVPTSGIYSAIAADLDQNGQSEIYVGGDDAVFVLSAEGQLLATVPANPDAMSRDARVSVRAATANGLENSDGAAVRAVVDSALDDIRSCYSDRMGADQFTRVGQMLWELTVDDEGSVSDTNKRHSSLRNTALDSCVEGVLEGITFSPASDSEGLVNVTLDFTFVDVP